MWDGAGMVGLETRGRHGSVSTRREVVDSVVEKGLIGRAVCETGRIRGTGECCSALRECSQGNA